MSVNVLYGMEAACLCVGLMTVDGAACVSPARVQDISPLFHLHPMYSMKEA